MPDRLTDNELRTLATLLYRFASTDLDQFENWRLPTPDGEAYLTLTNGGPAPGASPEAYTDISGWIDAGSDGNANRTPPRHRP
jgi:hypothetical protein